MNERSDIGRILSHLEQLMKELEIAFEQYFAGVEKRAPLKERELMARRLRQFASRHIVQTDLRFRYQNLATRFHSYGAYWDRILRLIEEGRYARQQGALPKTPAANALPPAPGADAVPPPGGTPAASGMDIESIYKELAAAHAACHLKVPQRRQIEEFLTQQRDKIRQKFGDRPVAFRVEIEGGKPKLKVKAKE
jgi:hypothetical protein